MNTLFETTASAELLDLWLVTAGKGLAILLFVTLVCVALQRASASLRHLCWGLGMIAVLILPALSLLLPQWNVALMQHPVRPVADVEAVVDVEADVTAPAPEPFATFDASSTPAPDAVSKSDAMSAPGAASAPGAMYARDAASASGGASASGQTAAPGVTAATGAISESVPAPSPPGVSATPWYASLSVSGWILAIWALGAALLLLHMFVSSLVVRRLIVKARPVTDPSWFDLLQEMSDRLVIGRPVQLLESDRITVPIVWGVMRPVLLLPEESGEWTEDRKRCVVAHELAHVRRWDSLTQSAAHVACIVHWFNPLAWRAARGMRLEREKACDDLVLRISHARASEYASHLLDLARNVPGTLSTPAGAIAMARRSQLEGRVLAILDEGRCRRLARPSAVVTVLFTVLVLLPIAAMSPFETDRVVESEWIVAEKGVSEIATSEAVESEKAAPEKAGDTRATDKTVGSDEVAGETVVSVKVVPDAVTFDGITIDGLRTRIETAVRAAASYITAFDRQAGGDVKASTANVRTASQDDVERTFRVADGGWLQIDTDHGNIDVESGAAGEVQVTVKRVPRGRAVAEDFEVSFEQVGDKISIRGDNTIRNGGRDGVNVSFLVRVPRRFNVDLQTSGGNIAVDDLDGRAKLNTAGGNLSIGRVTGEVDANTSGGNISVDGSNANVVVNTSGGNISLGRVGGTVRATTSGGNISLEEVNGDVTAKTSGGQISARLARQPEGSSLLKTSGGGITVYLADEISVDLAAKTSAGRVYSDVDVTTRGELKKDRLLGTINGGGPALELETSAGNIHIRRL